jgi:hypothetical protein
MESYLVGAKATYEGLTIDPHLPFDKASIKREFRGATYEISISNPENKYKADAYEITVDAIGKSSIPYTNSILERWAAANLHTLAEIDAAEQARAAAGHTQAAPGNSFDTDDFFDAALKRSFGDDYDPGKK